MSGLTGRQSDIPKIGSPAQGLEADDGSPYFELAVAGTPADGGRRAICDRYHGTLVTPALRIKGANVHFMIVDSFGDTEEVYRAEIPGSTFSSTGNAGDFTTAHEKLVDRMRDEGQDTSLVDRCTDMWYLGDEDLSDPSIFSKGRFTEKKDVDGDIWLWGKVINGQVWFFKDGTKPENVIYKSSKMLKGTIYKFPSNLASKELEPRCNLNANFGQNPSTGFSGWHSDMALKSAAVTSCEVVNGVKLYYGRNRCTLRTEVAQGSEAVGSDWDLRVAPKDSAAKHPGIIPTFTEAKHTGYDKDGKSFELAPIGDSGYGHTAFYWGELAHLSVPATAYRKMADGRWRSYRFDAWLDSTEAKGQSADSGSAVKGRSARKSGTVRMDEDTVRYIRWTEVVADGVVSDKR